MTRPTAEAVLEALEKVRERAVIRIKDEGNTGYLCFRVNAAIYDGAIGFDIGQYLRRWFVKQLAPYRSLNSWSSAPFEDLSALRLAWIDNMMAQCRAEIEGRK